MQKSKLPGMSARILSGLLFSISLFSYSPAPSGGDHFQIYLDKKLVLEQHVMQSAAVKTISLQAAREDSRLDVYYNHCGELGRSRTILLKDEKDHLLKAFRFKDGEKFMTCAARDIITLQKKNGSSTINLYYVASQSPAPRLLANIMVDAGNRSLTSK